MQTEPLRDVPSHFSSADRLAFLAIAQRARTERVNRYSVVSVGGQNYMHNCLPDCQPTRQPAECAEVPAGEER